jgi:hypothetical protein
LKMKIHRASVARLFEQNDLVLPRRSRGSANSHCRCEHACNRRVCSLK